MDKRKKVHIDLDSMLRKMKWDTVLVQNLVCTGIAQPRLLGIQRLMNTVPRWT